MPRKRPLKPKLVLLADRIAEALEKLRVAGAPTREAEAALRASSLPHLLAHDRKLKEETETKKGETKLKSGHKKAWAC